MNEADIRQLLSSDPERMKVIRAATELGLEDWWIGAGFVRNAVWDHLFGEGKKTPLNDIDLVYYKPLSTYGVDARDLEVKIVANEPNPVWEEESAYIERLTKILPQYEFDLKNQARMHLWAGRTVERKPYTSAAEGIAEWVETATTVGVRMNTKGELEILVCHGIEDLVMGIVRPTQIALTERARERAEAKEWFTRWPALQFENVR